MTSVEVIVVCKIDIGVALIIRHIMLFKLDAVYTVEHQIVFIVK